MFRIKFEIAVISIFTFFLVACSPGLSKSLRVDAIPEGDSVTKGDRLDMSVGLSAVEDLRSKPSVANIDGRELMPQGSVASSVEEAFRRESGRHGLLLSSSGSPHLHIEVLDWFIDISPAFPLTTVDSRAELRFKLTGDDGEQLYLATYSGDFSAKHPFLSQSKVEEYLGAAMREAIATALKDNELIGAMYRSSR